jgi:hypothetical protein
MTLVIDIACPYGTPIFMKSESFRERNNAPVIAFPNNNKTYLELKGKIGTKKKNLLFKTGAVEKTTLFGTKNDSSCSSVRVPNQSGS